MIRSSTVRVAALAVALSGGGIAMNCSKGSNNPGSTGSGKVSLAFALPSGAAINSVTYDIKAGAPAGIPDVTGTINTSDPNATASVDHSFPASTGDTVTMDATTTTGVSCHGVSTPFSVTAGGTAQVSVTLVCGAATNPDGPGHVIVNSTVVEGNSCPYLTSWVASPLQTSVGGTIDVGAAAADLSMPADTLTYAWTPTANFTNPTAPTTQFHCTAPGTQTITITVNDNHGASACTAHVDIQVNCVAVSVCGNGIVELGEQCDPPNGTTCDSNCQNIVAATGGSTGTAGAGGAGGATGGNVGSGGVVATGGSVGTGGVMATGGNVGTGGGMAGQGGTGAQPVACTNCELAATADGTCFNTSVDGTTNGCDGFPAGPQQDACYALVTCIRTGNGSGHTCANLDDATPCLCGTLSATACGQSDPTTLPGVCRAQYIAANGGSGTGIFGSFFSTSSPVGIANNMFTCDVDMAADTGLTCPSSVCGVQ